MNRRMTINAICGTTPNNVTCDLYTKLGLMRWTGNQWNEDWGWNRKALGQLNDEALCLLYADAEKNSPRDF